MLNQRVLNLGTGVVVRGDLGLLHVSNPQFSGPKNESLNKIFKSKE